MRASASRRSPTFSRPVVLVVDDDASIRDVLALGLTASGFDVRTAADGSEAVALCQAGAHVDVVLSDCHMPGLDGLQTEAKLREIAPWIRFCLMSGSPDGNALPQDSTACFLAKPFALEDAANLLWRLVREPLGCAGV
jgi:CheY-like chemotaxis protein